MVKILRDFNQTKPPRVRCLIRQMRTQKKREARAAADAGSKYVGFFRVRIRHSLLYAGRHNKASQGVSFDQALFGRTIPLPRLGGLRLGCE